MTPPDLPGVGIPDRPGPALRFDVSPRRVVGVLAAGGIVVIACGVLSEIVRVGLGHPRLHGLVPLFDLDGESNVPATYEGAMLVLCAVTLWLVAAWRRQAGLPDALLLRLLSLLLLFMAVDEIAQFHELLSEPVRAALDLHGVLYYSWVVVYGVVVLALAALLLPAALRIPRPLRILVLAAAGIFVAGALGLELAGSGVADAGRRGDAIYSFLITFEEGLEMAGALLLLYALLIALRTSVETVQARFVPAQPPAAR